MRKLFWVALLAAFVIDAGAADDPAAKAVPDLPALVRSYLTDAARLRAKNLSPEERATLTQQVAAKRAALKDARKQLRLASGAKPFGDPPVGSGKANQSKQCAGCKYVWTQINLNKVDPLYIQQVQAAFEKNCMNAQKSPEFYDACEDMYDDMYAMTDDYMSGDDAALICQKAQLCPK